MQEPIGSEFGRTGSRVLLRERELAARWGISVRTLKRWRAKAVGPDFIQLGHSVRYDLSDVVAFEDASRSGRVPA